MPQVDKQYTNAKEQATYGLGRSGNLRSSAANTLVADLAKQNDINKAGVRTQADTAAGDLRSQVGTEEQKAISQLYATEDPEVAANQSLAAVRDISLKQPDLSPLSALFNVATIGGANVLKGYQGQQKLNTFNSRRCRKTSLQQRHHGKFSASLNIITGETCVTRQSSPSARPSPAWPATPSIISASPERRRPAEESL